MAGNTKHAHSVALSRLPGNRSSRFVPYLIPGILGLAIMWGVKRGVYSNEAGQGTGPHAAAAAEVPHPAAQGLVQASDAFRYRDGRDLTGFIDGTENPQFPDDRAETALMTEGAGAFADGSFIFAQRYAHNLDKWKKLKVDAQELVMGRTKLESIELDDEVKPENSHVARTVVEDNEGEELAILRHSLPYGDGRGDQGLFFIAYTNDLSIIDSMLLRMFGTSGDGIHDRLLHFVTPMDGAYYFAPSEELLEEVLEG